MVCSEFAPWAKTGGLADAVAGLSHALAANGHDVRVLLPRYAALPAPVRSFAIDTPLGRIGIGAVAAADAAAPPLYTVDLGDLPAERIYTGDARDAGRFLRLAAAGAAFEVEGWRADVVHCHDWHAALTPVVQLLAARQTASILTLHNVGYQGVFADTVLRDYGARALERVLAPDARPGADVNFLRAGLRAATRITTVSPTYAAEILRPEFGMGLEDVLAERRGDLVGILNGVDYGVWSPERDPFIAARYSPRELGRKRTNKTELLRELRLDEPTAPLVGIVSRLAAQKGIDLFVAALPTLLAATRARFAVLASGDDSLARELGRFAREQPARIAFTDGYDEALAHRIFAGSDLTLVPSRYEPCGLTQMYALRYGTVPVVRATGGLADTVRHYDPATRVGTGSVFRDADVGGVLWGLRTALAWFDDEAAWGPLVANAVAEDFSWRRQVPHYEALYRSLA